MTLERLFKRGIYKNMKLSDIKNILNSTLDIKPVEIGCDDCEERMNEYAAYALQEKELDEQLNLVKNHLEVCKFCNEEFHALLNALESANTNQLLYGK